MSVTNLRPPSMDSWLEYPRHLYSSIFGIVKPNILGLWHMIVGWNILVRKLCMKGKNLSNVQVLHELSWQEWQYQKHS